MTTNKLAIDALTRYTPMAHGKMIWSPNGAYLKRDDVLAALAPTVQDAERTATQPAGEVGYDEATNLAKALYSQHYRNDAKEWRVLPDIRGVLSQISNMVAGMTRHGAVPAPQAAPTVQGSVDEQNLQRYDAPDSYPVGGFASMSATANGEYVKFEDVRAALAQRAAVAEVASGPDWRRVVQNTINYVDDGHYDKGEAINRLRRCLDDYPNSTASTPPAPASQIQWEANNPRAETDAASPLMQVAPSEAVAVMAGDLLGTAAAKRHTERIDAMHKGVVGVFAAIKAEHDAAHRVAPAPGATSGGEAVAVIGSGFQLLYCREDWSKGLKVSDALYPAPQSLPAASDASVREAIHQWRDPRHGGWHDASEEVAYERVDDHYEARTVFLSQDARKRSIRDAALEEAAETCENLVENIGDAAAYDDRDMCEWETERMETAIKCAQAIRALISKEAGNGN